jgi:carboxymethylenebutenolidase
MKNLYLILSAVVILIVLGVGYAILSPPGEQAAPVAAPEPAANVEMISGENKDGADVRISSQESAYFESVSGFLAKPESPGDYPGVIMIHEFWGLNDNVKMMAKELARSGYVVLAVDLYEGQVTDDRTRASELSSGINQERATANLRAATQYLRQNENVSRIASLGWCFGGGQSLQLALSGEPLDATVIYYGRLTSDQSMLNQIEWPVLGIFGAKDQSISVDSVNAFQNSLDELGVTNEIHIYPDVGHAFANPSGMNYAPNETRDAWEKTLTFLENNLKR